MSLLNSIIQPQGVCGAGGYDGRGVCEETCYKNDGGTGRIYRIEYYDSVTGQLCFTETQGCFCPV